MYYITATNCGQHTNYLCLKSEHLHAELQLLSTDQHTIAKQCSQLCFSAISTTVLINMRQKLGMPTMGFKENQTQYVRKKARGELSNLTSDTSSADTLIESFDNPTEGLLMMTRKDRNQTLKSVSNVPGSELDIKLQSLYDANNLQGSQRLLLFFLYASDEEMQLLRMHPEFCSCDTTFGTNNEKKELFTIANGNNNAFNSGRAYIPNAQTWVFNTIFKHCLPIF